MEQPMNTPQHKERRPQDAATAVTPHPALVRLDSKDLFRAAREIEIAHDGRIYRLRLTQLNKLILTA
jgi:hemin uptake protein HemP